MVPVEDNSTEATESAAVQAQPQVSRGIYTGAFIQIIHFISHLPLVVSGGLGSVATLTYCTNYTKMSSI